MRGVILIIPLVAFIQSRADDSAANRIGYEHEPTSGLLHRSVHAWADDLADRTIRTPAFLSRALDDAALAKTTGGNRAASLDVFRDKSALAGRPFSHLAPCYQYGGPRPIVSTPHITSPDLRSSIISHAGGVVCFTGPNAKEAAKNALSFNGSMIGDDVVTVEPSTSRRGKTKVHVLGLSPFTTWELLKDTFTKYGAVSYARIVTGFIKKRPQFAEGRIRFDGPDAQEAAKSALALNGTSIDDHTITVELGVRDATRVFVKGLPQTTNSTKLMKAFEPYGKIKAANVQRGYNRTKGWKTSKPREKEDEEEDPPLEVAAASS